MSNAQQAVAPMDKISGSNTKTVSDKNGNNTAGWTQNPYDYKVYVQNMGECDKAVKNETVLYGVQMGFTNAFFTNHSVIFRYMETAPIEKGKDPDQSGAPKRTLHKASIEWVNCSPNVSVEAVDQQSYYHTFDAGKNKTIKANVFKRIIYHNLYPGIDVEYTFPEDGANEKKYGIKYNIIVHPGADLSQVKLKYTGIADAHVNKNGDVIWAGELGEVTDHAPIANYQGEKGNNIAVSYNVNNDEETFFIGAYDNTKTLVIDPWTSSPAFTTTNIAWWIDYDYAGNVYAYGGVGYELVKFNPAGTKQWMYTATTLSSSGAYIGGMCVDKHSENTYLSDGWNASGSGSQIEKISTAGVLLGTDPGNSSMDEIWTLEWDPCTYNVYGTGNGTCCPDQALQVDTNMASVTVANICAPTVTAGGYHDFGSAAVDPMGGFLYTTCSQSLTNPTIFDNYLFKCPLPALAPPTYNVPIHFAVDEFSSYSFAGNITNGYRGTAVSPNWTYIYQGDTLKQCNKATGAIAAVKQISATPYTWNGIDVDFCDDIYLGNNTSVQEYNSALALTNTYAMTGTIYDVRLNTPGSLMYAGGNGFVSAVTITPPPHVITKTRTDASGCSGCNGTASAALTLCGTPVAPANLTYSWSNGATTSSITALCPGTYTVTITMGIACTYSHNTYTDTVLITKTAGGGGVNLSTTQTNVSCSGGSNGSANVTVTSGIAPFTYLWSGGQTTSTLTGLSPGTYTITVTDSGGCTGTQTITITAPTPILITTSGTPSSCGSSTGTASANVSGGTNPYKYLWNNGATTSNITALAPGIYTINITDSNGCTGQDTITITAPGAPTITPSQTNVICYGGNSGNATVTVTGGSPPYTYSWSGGQTSSTINGLAAGTYSCAVKDASGCIITVTFIITQPSQLRDSVINATNPKCNGDKNGSIVIGTKGGANPLTYSWSNGTTNQNDTGLAAGAYTLTITDSNGCVSKINATLTQPTPVVVTTKGDSICGGLSTTLTGTGSGGTGPYTYMWNGVFPNQNYTVSPAGTTIYTVVATDAHGCSSLPANATVTVNPSPTVAFVADTLNGCSPQCIKFTDLTTITAGKLISWTWTFGDGGTDTNQNPNHCFTKPGVYSIGLTVTSNNGCKSTLNVPNLINIYSHPSANFVGSPQPANIMQPFIQFTDKSTDAYGIISWFWTFGDATDSTSSIENPGHTYQDTGTFCPTLIVTNIHQCTDSVEHCIVIDPLFTLYIPNAFTPNGDNRDDIFLPKGIYVCTFEMWIFDRWGMELFHTTDINQGWNGHVGSSSNMCQEDTYVYMINATDCEKHNKHSYVGRVSLIK